MTEPVGLRTAIGADLPALQRIFREASLSNPGDRPGLLEHPEHLVFAGEHLGTGSTRLAEVHGAPVGFATGVPGRPGELELEDLFVDPARRRRGIALRLVRDQAELARGRGLTRIAVTGNRHALAFYLAAGFVQVGEVPTALSPAPCLVLDL